MLIRASKADSKGDAYRAHGVIFFRSNEGHGGGAAHEMQSVEEE